MFAVFAEKSFVSLILRVGLAVIFIYHGWQKVSGEGHEWGAAWATKAGLAESNPLLSSGPAQLAVAWGELIGGIAVGIGFLTRLAAAGILVIMAGAIHMLWHNGFDAQKGGIEYNLALAVICIALMMMGGGTFSVDSFRRSGRKKFLG